MTTGNTSKFLRLWPRERSRLAPSALEFPFGSLQSQMNTLFDGMLGGWEDTPIGQLAQRATGFTPRVEVHENDKEVIIKAEVPGVDKKDIELSLHDDALLIRGKKLEEVREEREGGFYSERVYGEFSRTINLTGVEVDADKISAESDRGILTVRLPKKESAEKRTRTISIK